VASPTGPWRMVGTGVFQSVAPVPTPAAASTARLHDRATTGPRTWRCRPRRPGRLRAAQYLRAIDRDTRKRGVERRDRAMTTDPRPFREITSAPRDTDVEVLHRSSGSPEMLTRVTIARWDSVLHTWIRVGGDPDRRPLHRVRAWRPVCWCPARSPQADVVLPGQDGLIRRTPKDADLIALR
jgi:hypothetical protein